MSIANFCNGGVGTCFDVNTGNISSSVFMANAYVDLGTWWCLTPFIGAGVGGAYNRISGVLDQGIIANGSIRLRLHAQRQQFLDPGLERQAGLTYNVNNNLKIDFSWRFLDLGSPQTAIVQCQNTTGCPSAFYTLRDMTSQDFRISFRWMIQPNAGIGVMAVQPVFAPQPQYRAAAAALDPRLMPSGFNARQRDERAADALGAKFSDGLGAHASPRSVRRTVQKPFGNSDVFRVISEYPSICPNGASVSSCVACSLLSA